MAPGDRVYYLYPGKDGTPIKFAAVVLGLEQDVGVARGIHGFEDRAANHAGGDWRGQRRVDGFSLFGLVSAAGLRKDQCGRESGEHRNS